MIRNKRLVPDAVLDDEGRQRFHGAFTGGFSAGHYNTVGSEEGFKPTAFVSSRSNRASHIEQSANDFVDSEDGLLGAILSTNSEQVTIAVEDSGCVVKIPQAKANYFGIGYDPAVENPEISAYRNTVNQRGVGQGVYRMDALIPAASSGSRNSSDLLRNKGVGGFSLNDDEDDVYDNNNHDENSGRDGYTLQLSNKCRESDSDNEEQSFGNKARVKAKELTASVDKWLGSSVGGEKLCQRCPTDGREVLSGFVLSTLKLIKPIVVFAPPPAPRGFTALHIFHEEKDRNLSGSSSNSTSTVASNYQRHRRGNSVANASNLGDVTATAGVAPVINAVSISELIQAAMKNMANKNLEKNNMQTSTIDDGYKEKSPKTFAEAVPARPMLTSDALLKSTFAGLSKAFQGRFVSSTSSSSNDSNALIAGLTTAAEHAEITAASFSASTTSSTIAASTLTSNQQSSQSQSQSVSINSHSNRNIPEVSSSSNGNKILETSKISKIQSLSNYKSDTLSSVTVKYNVKAEDNKTVPAIDSSSLKGKASRVSRAWYPVPLLSRRFNIKIDGENNGTKGGRQQQQQQLRQLESRTVDSQLDSMFAGLRDPGPVPSSSFSSSSTDIMPVTSFSSRKSLPSEREHDEFILLKEVKIEETPVVEKPPMSLFKSIFENGDSSDSSDDDTDDDDGKKDEKEDEKDEKEGVRESAQERDRVMEEKKKILLAKTVLELAKEEEIKSTASALVSKSILLGNTSKGKDTRVSASVAIPTDTHGQDLRNKEKSQIISSIKTINSGNNNNENNKSKNSDSSQSMVINLSRDGNGDDSVTTSNETEEKEKEIVSEEKGRVVFRKPVTKGKLNTFSNKSKNKRVVNVMSFKDEEEEEDEGTNGPRLISKIPSKIAKVKNEAFILSNTDNEELIIEEENVQLTLEGFTETMTAHNTHEEKEAGKEVVHKEEPTYVLGCTNLKADSMIETDETRTVTEWYARNEMKKKEREEIVRKLKYEEEMQVIAVMNQKLLCTDTVEHEKHKKERKRKHSNHTEEKEREKDRKNEKKSHKTLKSKKSKKSKKSSRDSCQSAKRQKGSGNDTNSSESESD